MFGCQELGEFVEIGSTSVILELIEEGFPFVFGADVEFLEFLSSEYTVFVIVDDPQEGFGEVLIS